MVFTLRDLNARGPIIQRYKTQAPLTIPQWRWYALGALVIALGHARVSGDTLELALVGRAPAHVAFASWYLVLAGLVAYAVFQLAEGQRRLAVYDRLSRPTVAIATLAVVMTTTAAWSVWLAMPFAVALAAVAGVAYVRVHREPGPRWIGVPFALVFAFSLVVAAAALDACVTHAGDLAIAAAAVAIVRLGLRHREPVLPGFAAWLCIGVCSEHPGAQVALLAGGVCAAVCVFVAATRLSPSRPVASLSPSPRSHRA